MPRSRFVLRYQGPGTRPEADVARVAALSGVVIVDSSPRMLLVDVGARAEAEARAGAEAGAEALSALVAELADWVMAPEQHLPLPDTCRQAERAPKPPGA